MRKHKCDGGAPDCSDGSDESAEACGATGRQAAMGTGAGTAASAGSAVANGAGIGGKASVGEKEGEEEGDDVVLPMIGAGLGFLALAFAGAIYAVRRSAKARKATTNAASNGPNGPEGTAAAAANFNVSVQNRAFNPDDGELCVGFTFRTLLAKHLATRD